MNPFAYSLSAEDESAELSIPLPTAADEDAMNQQKVPRSLPVMALRNTVLFPGVVLPITVGRDASLKLVRDAYKADRLVGVISQKAPDVEEPTPEELYSVGTVASILKVIRMPDGSKNMVIQGKRRFRLLEFTQRKPYFRARVEPFAHKEDQRDEIELEALMRSVKELSVEMVELSPNLPSEAAEAIESIDSMSFLVHFIASNLQIGVSEKQELLETASIVERATMLAKHLDKEIKVLRISDDIRSRMKSDVDQQQREYFLRQQLRAIQDELGEGDDTSELDGLRKRAQEKNLPEAVQKAFDKEISKLQRSNPALPDYAVTRNYVDWILDLPWTEHTEDQLDIADAEKVLDEDHYGLEKVKKRILEHLAVLKLKGDMKAPILCFYGPPGVGKTSLGRSIARAMGRKFVRMSLGGVNDEAEIRGHRRTYIGSMPGRVLQGLRKCGSGNPVFMLDEVDKLGETHRGSPSHALLEVLDPEQNSAFNDHYIELDYDLSSILFIATANYLQHIPAPLRDRMEIINITGYTQGEKLCIAKGFLVPRQIERNGLMADQLSIEDGALEEIVDGYTRESGVRQLERAIGSVSRGVAKKVATEEITAATIVKDDIAEYLGAREFYSDVAERTEVPGVATGLAWTPTGGDILFVESSVTRGSGKLIRTGSLGDVMKESAQAALSYVKSLASTLAIPNHAFTGYDVHVHVPAGAISKDGPSAGVALLASLVSIYTQRRVRHNLAMTGEITLRGLVLPVGGIKEKVLAAKRAGITQVVLPKKNEKDVLEINSQALEGLGIAYIHRMDELLELALESEPMYDLETVFPKHTPAFGAPAAVSAN